MLRTDHMAPGILAGGYDSDVISLAAAGHYFKQDHTMSYCLE